MLSSYPSLPYQMSSPERRRIQILVVETDSSNRSRLRQTLTSLEYGLVVDVTDHNLALQKMEEQEFSHVIFDSKKTSITSQIFLATALEMRPELVCIPSAYDSTIDEIFSFLALGAKGFLTKPLTIDGIDQSIILATKAEPIPDAVLSAKDRNGALAAMLLTALDRCCIMFKQARRFETAKRDIPKTVFAFKRANELAQTFAKGGIEELLPSIVEFCIEHSEGGSKVGRIRKRVREKVESTDKKKVAALIQPITKE